MPTLISSDLRCRLVLLPRGYQFDSADNLYDLNWIDIGARIASPGEISRLVRTRLATWELDAIADHCVNLASGQRAMWHPRFFDSGLHLWVQRSSDRGDTCLVTVLLSAVTGPLPVDGLDLWRGDRFRHPEGLCEGVRFPCTFAALALFASELRAAMSGFPMRPLQKTG